MLFLSCLFSGPIGTDKPPVVRTTESNGNPTLPDGAKPQTGMYVSPIICFPQDSSFSKLRKTDLCMYTAKLLFHQSPTRHSDYTVSGQ